MKLLLWGMGVLAVVAALDRVLLWCESRGWLNYRRTGLSGGGAVYHALELHSVFDPGIEEVQAVRYADQQQEDESGAPPGDREVASEGRGRMTDGPGVGVGLIIRKGDEVLLIRRAGAHGGGTWSTPGGHLDRGESPEECAVREALEETGIEVADVRFRALTNDLFEDGRHYVTIWMEGSYLEGEPSLEATDEASELGWFSWDDLPGPLFLSFENLVAGRCYPPPRGGGGADP